MDVKNSNGNKVGYVEGNDIKNPSGNRVGYVEGNDIKKPSGNRVGYVEGNDIKNPSGNKLGYVDGNDIKKPSGNKVGYVEGGGSKTHAGAAGLLLLLQPKPEPGTGPSEDGPSGCLGAILLFFVSFFRRLSFAGKIGALVGFVLMVIGSFATDPGNVIFMAPLGLILGGGIGALTGFIFRKLSRTGKFGMIIGAGIAGLFLGIVAIVAEYGAFIDVAIFTFVGTFPGGLIGALIGSIIGFIKNKT